MHMSAEYLIKNNVVSSETGGGFLAMLAQYATVHDCDMWSRIEKMFSIKHEARELVFVFFLLLDVLVQLALQLG